MKRFYSKSGIAAGVTLGGWALMATAHAAPPTVTPSPGYDARLQEQRAARAVFEPAVPTTIVSRRVRRHRHHAH